MKSHHQQHPATFQEIRKILRDLSKSQKETDRAIKETTEQIKRSEALFNSRWGKFVESLVEGKLIALLQSRDIDVNETYSRIQRSYRDERGELQKREIDIIAANGKEVVAVEVKSTLNPDDVKYFMETLKIFKRYFSIYANKTVYGAVAYLRSDSQAPLFAERQGLFVIRATGDSASLANNPGFKPKAF